MMNRHKVRIKTTTPPAADVFIDDKKINATKFKFEHDAGCLAMLTIYGFEDTEIEEDAIVVIDNTPQWIPVNERLPKEEDYRPCVENPDGAVWWKDSKGNIGLGWYYESTKEWADLNDHGPQNEVVAWMRIPETEVEDEY